MGSVMHDKTAAASDLKSHIGFWMRIVSNAVSHSFARKLESSGVTVAEWVVLREMYGGSPTTSPSEVAQLIGLSRGAVSKLIERLVRKTLVSRAAASRDRRYQDIQLTPAAMALVPKLAGLADENDAEFFGALTKAERKTLLEILKRMAQLHQLNRLPVE